eukprot:scaffold125023_cov71-Attheya_sp.AAC.1
MVESIRMLLLMLRYSFACVENEKSDLDFRFIPWEPYFEGSPSILPILYRTHKPGVLAVLALSEMWPLLRPSLIVGGWARPPKPSNLGGQSNPAI